MTTPQRVAVIGAGMIGSTIAAALDISGVDTTIVTTDATGRGPVARASFAWVNARAKAPEHYQRLNADARRLWNELSPRWFHATGARADGEEFSDDGWVDTTDCITASLEAVSHIRIEEVIDTSALRQEFDAVVVASGASAAALTHGSPRLTTTAGDEGHLVRIAVDDAPFDGILSLGGLQVRPDGEGRVAAQSLDIERRLREKHTPATVEAVWPALRAEIGAKTGWEAPTDVGITLDRARRTHPADGLPVIGWVGSVYAVVAHSGVTLAPLLADLVTRDLRGDADPRLAPFRP